MVWVNCQLDIFCNRLGKFSVRNFPDGFGLWGYSGWCYWLHKLMWETQVPFGQHHSLGRAILSYTEVVEKLLACIYFSVLWAAVRLWFSCFGFQPWLFVRTGYITRRWKQSKFFYCKLLFVRVFCHTDRNRTRTDINVTNLQEEASHMNLKTWRREGDH